MLYTVLNARAQETESLTCAQLHKRAERVASMLLDKAQLVAGDHVALVFAPGTDLIVGFYACLYAGLVPITIRPPHHKNVATTLPTIRLIVEMGRVRALVSLAAICKLFRGKEAAQVVDVSHWPPLVEIDSALSSSGGGGGGSGGKKKPMAAWHRPASGDSLCYLDFSVSAIGVLTAVRLTHASVTSLCRAIKLACELYPSREVVLCLDPYVGLGFVLWCLNRFDKNKSFKKIIRI